MDASCFDAGSQDEPGRQGRPKKFTAAAVAVAVVLSGCGTPGTPGSGAGADYVPIIDTSAGDMSRYSTDLADCRRLAKNIDADREAMIGAIGGAVLGAMLGAAVGGGNSRYVDAGASGGMAGGLSGSTNSALTRQRTVVINCMAGRGYRTLDGSNVVLVQQTGGPSAAPPQVLGVPIAAPPAPATAAPRAAIGQESHQVERMPEAKTCNATPVAALVGKGPGQETYSVACTNGETLAIRCEFGACRVLK